MNSNNYSLNRVNKNCFVAFRNKKLNNFEFENSIIKTIAGYGYYFNKISFVAYDSPEEIVSALIDGRENNENMFICCPVEMESMLKNFIKSLYSAEFNELGILKTDVGCAFLLFSDSENRLRFTDIKNVLDEKYGVRYEKEYVKTVGASASDIKSAIQKSIEVDRENVTKYINFNVCENFGESTIEVVYSDKITKGVFDGVFRTLVGSLNESVYAIEDVSLAERLYQLLTLRKMKIGVAESFTGGGIGKKLVEIPGISEVYSEGLNTYSNESKINRLGVNEFTIRQYGAVSEQTAREMAEGLLRSGNCDVAVATTGIAGPKSDNSAKPVGLCYIAVGTEENIDVREYRLNGNRENVTNTAINLALFLACKLLK